MTKKDTKLRTLSIAYAVGRLDKDTYRRLRMSQLSALDFDKPTPKLPENLLDIEVPKIKIDLPRSNHPPKKSLPIPALIAGFVVLVIAIGICLYIF